MGPPAAVQVLRDSLYRGADEVILLSDKDFAGADTLATSYTLALAVRKLGPATSCSAAARRSTATRPR